MLYKVRQQEIWDVYTAIEAESAEEAIKKVVDGQGDQVFSEYNRQHHQFEPTAEEYRNDKD